ncbi:MAG: HAMP domain-containing histidine kinase [Clostridiales bacterium]|nr:HAMP domain-containing histidine kinase [Clostridiales bacterium]
MSDKRNILSDKSKINDANQNDTDPNKLKDANEPKDAKHHRITTLLFLTIFVFVILLVSIIISGFVSYFLMSQGILPPLSEIRFPVLLLFLLMVSLLIGTLLAILGGDIFLRPLNTLVEATKRVADGDFSVRVETKGSNEIKRLTESFNDMTKQLASIEAMRNDLIDNISHEFKTPIVSIRGFANRLKKKSLSEKQRDDYLDIIILETERLARLSSNILLLSKLENIEKVFEKETYSLDEQLRNAILILQPQLEKKSLELDIELDSVQITRNKEMINHVWSNLLENAIKFSPEGATIKVSLKSNEDFILVSIADEGIGMNLQEQKQIFDKFYQSDHSRVTEGSGLGLALVKRILKLCNGKIEVASVPGEGSCFTVTIIK